MTTDGARKEWQDAKVDESVDVALDWVKNTIAWLEHVPEAEFTARDKQHIICAARAFYAVVRPMTAKYIDGEEDLETRASGTEVA